MLKLGDLVVNEYASRQNPHRVLMVVRSRRKRTSCLALDGAPVLFDDNPLLRKVGNIGIEQWRVLVNKEARVEATK